MEDAIKVDRLKGLFFIFLTKTLKKFWLEILLFYKETESQIQRDLDGDRKIETKSQR